MKNQKSMLEKELKLNQEQHMQMISLCSYYVLMGKLQPIQGVGAESLNLQRLIDRVQDGQVKEVILATNYTTEGETTAHYLSQLLRPQDIKVTRIARGVPAGSELEYVDAGTIAWALMERKV